jgi:hypothetical protein
MVQPVADWCDAFQASHRIASARNTQQEYDPSIDAMKSNAS